MDTSETYITMCKQAEEIQKLSPRKDFTLDFYSEGGRIISYGHRRLEETHQAVIWLPRQDQLQTMVKDEGDDDFSLVELFYNYVWGDGQPNEIDSPLNTMERMWLAFVMQEKYGKVWNGEEWIKC